MNRPRLIRSWSAGLVLAEIRSMNTKHHNPAANIPEPKANEPVRDRGRGETGDDPDLEGKQVRTDQNEKERTGSEQQTEGRDVPPAGSKRNPNSPWLGGG